MTSASDVNIPSFSPDVVESLPIQYKAMALYLAGAGRVIIKPSETTVEEKGF